MRFFVRKRRNPPAVIIIALIDILIVMLIFMMATTTFRHHPALRLALPESSQAQQSGATESPPLIVSITASGSLYFGPEDLPVTLDRLKSELALQASQNAQLRLAISADKDAPFGQIVKVMDAAKEAGITAVNAFTKEPGWP